MTLTHDGAALAASHAELLAVSRGLVNGIDHWMREWCLLCDGVLPCTSSLCDVGRARAAIARAEALGAAGEGE